MLRWLLALVLLAPPCAAQAAWREAVSDHFIVYSEGSDAELRQAASDLEKYDYLLRLMLDTPKDHPIRLKIYMMKDEDAVQETMGFGSNTGVAGYYEATPRGSMAVTMRGEIGWAPEGFDGQMVLFHEYAHHLMLQYYAAAYPSWYVEGFAEYYGPTRILPNGFEVGQMAAYRRASFHGDADWMPLKRLLTARNYKDIDGRVDLLYAEGWLLVHYLADNAQRSGQLRKYLASINQRGDYKAAMDAAFGPDAAELNSELRRYSQKPRLEAIRITFPAIDVGTIDIHGLGAARSALMLQEIELGRGIYAKDVAAFTAEVKRIAAGFPDDPDALAILAEAGRLGGDREAALAAVERWLALRPGDARGLMFKGLLGVDALAAAGSKDATAWAGARKWLADARKAAPEDPMVLKAYFDGYAAEGILPPPRAQNALYHAMELIPQDSELRYQVAGDFERRGLIEAAILAIRPAAFRAHAPDEESEKDKAKREKLEERWRAADETRHERPREMLARLEAKFAAAGSQQGQSPSQPAAQH